MDTKKRARQRLKVIEQSLAEVLIVHYSCESFADKPDGYSPRISSIAVKDFESAQTQSFSIHNVAEIEGILRSEIEQHYDRLERTMLDELSAFLAANKSCIYVHWNMRNATYGFQAINHRHRTLGGTPFSIDDHRLIDLARLLGDLHGPDYIDHPKMEKLIDLNNITKKHFLTGAEEAGAFEKKEYYRLHLSTLRKVDAFSEILEKQLQGKLKTKIHPAIARIQEMHEHWLFQAAELVLALIGLGAAVYAFASLFK